MRIMILAACLAVLAAAAGNAQQDSLGNDKEMPKTFELGKKVPGKLELVDIDGNTTTFKDLRGKVVVVTFWSDSCPYMKPAEPKFAKLYDDFVGKGDKVVMIGIAANQREITDKTDGYARIRKHKEKMEIEYPLYVDHGNKITDRFAAKTTPHCFVIAADGTLAYAGALDDDPRGSKGEGTTHYVRDAIKSLLASKPVATKSTKPYG